VRITVVHHAALGDTVLLIPLLRALREKFGGEAGITVVTRPAFGRLLQGLGHVDGWASADAVEHAAWFGADAEIIVPEWATAELLLSAVSNGCDAWAANARRVGSGTIYFFEPRPAREYRGHVTAWHREQLAELKLPEPALPTYRENPQGHVAIHPGSGGEAKCWALENFLALGEKMREDGVVPMFLVGDVERERWGDQVIAGIGGKFAVVQEEELCVVASRLAAARLYVGNDSGITHLAAALGGSVVALFGASDEVQWRPVGARVRVVSAEEGMSGLGVEEVWQVIRRELGN
jgi:heptosyltransferase III